MRTKWWPCFTILLLMIGGNGGAADLAGVDIHGFISQGFLWSDENNYLERAGPGGRIPVPGNHRRFRGVGFSGGPGFRGVLWERFLSVHGLAGNGDLLLRPLSVKEDKGGERFEAMGQPDFRAWQKDLALTARFDVNQNWLLKLEGHVMDGTADLFVSDNPDGFDQDWFLFAAKVTFSF